VYKIVRNEDRRLVSPCAVYSWQVEYIPHEWVYAKRGKLFVFSDLYFATQFLHTFKQRDNLQIWECETTNEELITHVAIAASANEMFWEGKVSSWETTAAPEGTWISPAIKLTERVR
jgi:hypothetical protein